MKVVHLTSVHERYDARIFLKECRSLAAAAYAVHLIVADGKNDEIKNNIHIHDVGKQSNRLKRMLKTTQQMYHKAISLEADIYHFHDPELIPIALKLKKKDKRVIFDIHENTALQINTKKWIPKLLRYFVSTAYKIYEGWACKKFNALIVPQVSMKDFYSKYALTEILFNFPNRSDDDIEISIDKKQKKQLIYAGSITEDRGLFNMLELIKILGEKDSDYKLILAGPIDTGLLKSAKKHSGWKHTIYKGNLTKQELYLEYRNSAIGLTLFNNVGQYYMAFSLKVFEYMQNGLTLILPNFGDWVSFNGTYQAGYTVDVIDALHTASIISNTSTEKLTSFCKKNQEKYKTHFLWEFQEKKLLDLYSNILQEK